MINICDNDNQYSDNDDDDNKEKKVANSDMRERTDSFSMTSFLTTRKHNNPMLFCPDLKTQIPCAVCLLIRISFPKL